MLTTVPKDIPDRAPDPFTDKSVPIGDVYGYNWNWSNYDLGCGNDFLRDPAAVTNTKTGNIVLSIVGAALAGMASLEQMAKSSSLNWLTNVIGGIADKLRGPVLALWLPLAMLGVGLIVGLRAKRSSYADTLRTLLIIGAAATIAVFALVFPTTASKGVDRAVVAVSDATGSQFSASPSDSITRESAYRTWLTGNFGDPDSAMARELGPRLVNATHYSWSDMKRIQADPKSKDQIDHAKAAEFKNIADELKQRDPAGYEFFTGRGERTGPAMFGVVVVLAMSLFVGMAMLMVLVARVMMQGLALAAPLAAVLGVLPTHTSVLSRLWDLFTAALVAVAKFVIAGGVMAMVLGAIQTNDSLGAGAKLFWVLVATVVGIVLTRPIRSFKTIVPGLDPNQSYLRTALNGVAGYFGARLGEDVHRNIGDGSGPKAGNPLPTAPPTDARQSLPALPAPVWTTGESSHLIRLDTAAHRPSASHDWERGRAWPGVVGEPAPAALPTAPQRLEASPAPAQVVVATAPMALPAGGTPADLSDTSSTTEFTDPPTTPPTSGDDFPRPRPTSPAESGTEVIYPTGIIVSDDESPLYRSSKTREGAIGETYIPMADPELAEDGSEQELVTYHSPGGTARASA
jgi:hypothetical protein